MATTPDEDRRTREADPPPVYRGPPSYPAPPRWGLPLLGWRAPTSVPAMAPQFGDADTRARLVAIPATRALWATTVILLLAAFAEAWRYALLVISADNALRLQTVRLSDTAVQTGALMSVILGIGSVGIGLLWLLRARQAAAELAGVRPSRPAWQATIGFLIPGMNLVVPGSVLAELEHTAAQRPADQRPRPSRLVRTWWLCWSANLVLGAIAFLWQFRSGAQNMADGVLIHLALNLTAAAVAVLSIQVIRRVSLFLDPVDVRNTARMRVVRVEGDPSTVERRKRPADQAR
ncbi:DUF4328 domain-containing protein [Actinoalloteichus hymeniacidonis]|uniref:DUF4328 domain-containing protein n=1 Tax=Actinoalloteichus hymeniacidonis TaxID=340345 RepID=UPI000A6D8D80|nr:DUF4328 domain-containing protein [Actinoalloteichus hymeniacidonis]MBB5911080.1 hypothetical protein [Actinoalloteichus hymeniacidonis]